jgi:hypothetical protein
LVAITRSWPKTRDFRQPEAYAGTSVMDEVVKRLDGDLGDVVSVAHSLVAKRRSR